MQQRVEQQRGLVAALLLAQRRVQAVEVDLEGVGLLAGPGRVCVRERTIVSAVSPASRPTGGGLTLTLRVSEAGDGLPVRVGPVGAVGQVGQDQEQQQALIGQRQRLALLLQPRSAGGSAQGEDAPQAACRCGRAKSMKVPERSSRFRQELSPESAVIQIC